MSQPYLNEEAKMAKFERHAWGNSCDLICDILRDKGYQANAVCRVGADRKVHDALLVERADIPQLIEEFFRQRIVAEYQAEGKRNASIINSYDYSAASIIDACKRFRKNKNEVKE